MSDIQRTSEQEAAWAAEQEVLRELAELMPQIAANLSQQVPAEPLPSEQTAVRHAKSVAPRRARGVAGHVQSSQPESSKSLHPFDALIQVGAAAILFFGSIGIADIHRIDCALCGLSGRLPQ